MSKKSKRTNASPQSTPDPKTPDATKRPPEQPLPLSLTEQVGSTDTLTAVINHYHAWLPRYQSFSQGRSNFQIEKMIATEHATPVASYQHTLYQLRVLHQSLMNDFIHGIEAKRTFDYKWADTDTTKPQLYEAGKEGKKLCWYDTDKIRLEHELEELKMSITDKLLQLQTFTKILQAMENAHGGPFTQQELEAEEPEYWRLRIARQMGDEYLDRQTGLGTGNLKTLRMAVADSPLPESKNRVENFPDLVNAVLSGRESSLAALNQLNEELFGYMNNLGATERTVTLPTDHQPATTNAVKPQDPPDVRRDHSSTPSSAASVSSEQLAKLRSLGISTESDE